MITPIIPASAKKRKPRPALLLLLLASFSTFQIACVQLAEIDSTHSPVYSSMIGREFELKAEFLVRGVKWNQRSTEPDYILVMPPPGIGGRFIFDLGRVPAGSHFRIVGVVTHRSKLFPSTRYVISFVEHRISQAEDKEVRIPDFSGWLYVKPASSDEAPQLSERYFRPLEKVRK